ncbi:Cyclin-U2-1 [Pichia kudriavzevii]|uniref:Cyclin-U2-1 n=1 Tax=Pichia kudriavzevii TaxID=4909 RepID=A0A1V2LIW5_PICKU|nr:Cyclin-U2-1 [Pichia kudriavzevii]
MPQNNTHVEETLHPNKTRFNNSNNPNSSISINNGDPKAILINTQLSHLNQLNHLSHANRFPPNDLLVMLSALLQKIIEANDILHTDGNLNPVIPSSSVNATSTSSSFSNETTHLFNDKYNANVMAFRGRNIPAISIYSYLKRIIKYCPATNDVFLSLLVYFDRIAKRANNTVHTQEDAIMQDDTTESPSESPFQVFVMDSYNIHRLIIAGVIVASKFLSDVFYKNSRYAKVGGLPLEELNHLELQFLLLLDFQLMIQKEELEKYAELLSRFWKRQQLQQQQQQQQQQQPQQPPPT